MNEGFTLDPAKGEITIIEQDLYNSDNFGSETSFAQLDKIEGTVEMTVTVNSDSQIIGSATQSFSSRKQKKHLQKRKLRKHKNLIFLFLNPLPKSALKE